MTDDSAQLALECLALVERYRARCEELSVELAAHREKDAIVERAIRCCGVDFLSRFQQELSLQYTCAQLERIH